MLLFVLFFYVLFSYKNTLADVLLLFCLWKASSQLALPGTHNSVFSPWRWSSWADTAPAGRTTSSCTPWTEPPTSPRGSAAPERPSWQRRPGHRPPSPPRLSPGCRLVFAATGEALSQCGKLKCANEWLTPKKYWKYSKKKKNAVWLDVSPVVYRVQSIVVVFFPSRRWRRLSSR